MGSACQRAVIALERITKLSITALAFAPWKSLPHTALALSSLCQPLSSLYAVAFKQ